jgi:hypothetical protein
MAPLFSHILKNAMPHNKPANTQRHNERVTRNENINIKTLAEKLGCTVQELKAAVQKADTLFKKPIKERGRSIPIYNGFSTLIQ